MREPDPGVVVITVKDGGAIEVNQEGAVAPAEVPSRLKTLFLARGNVTLFVRADPGLTFEPVAHLIDLASGAGLKRIALMRR